MKHFKKRRKIKRKEKLKIMMQHLMQQFRKFSINLLNYMEKRVHFRKFDPKGNIQKISL